MIFDSSAFLVFRAENRLFKDPDPGINWYLTFHRFTVVHDYIQAPKSLFCAWQRLSGNVLAFDIFRASLIVRQNSKPNIVAGQFS